MLLRYALPALLLALAPALAAQSTVEVVAEGLVGPIGVAVGPDGRVWVAEAGSGNDDGRVSAVVNGAVVPVVAGLPSVGFDGEVDGTAHLLFHDGDLWVVGGAGPSPAFDLLRYSLDGITVGADALGPDDADAQHNVGAWVLAGGFAESNVYDAAPGPDGSLVLSDAAANAVLRFRPDADTAVVATLASVETGGTPPMADAVPTGLLTDGDDVLVGTLTGFPFSQGSASVMRVGMDGTTAEAHPGLTLVTDLARDPRDGSVIAIEFGRHQLPNGFLPGTGRIVRLLDDGAVEVIADGLNLVTGIAFAPDGTLYVTSLFGQLLAVSFAATSSEGGPTDAHLDLAASPNPFGPATDLSYTLTEPSDVRLAVYDALGREVAVLAEGARGPGAHTARLDGAGLAAGVYVARLVAGGHVEALTVVRAR